MLLSVLCLFFFNDTATTEIYTLSLHDALPIWVDDARALGRAEIRVDAAALVRELGVDGELHVLRRQRIAVVELHATPQVKAPCRRIRVLPAHGQHRL